MIIEDIKNDLKEAMKASDQVRVSVLRFLLSAVHNKEIVLHRQLAVQGKNLPDEEVVEVIRQQIKQRKESIEAFKTGGRDDLVEKEQEELEILSKYLPQQISQGELTKIIEEMVKETEATGPGDFGKVMGAVMAKVKGQAEGTKVAEMVKKSLSEGKLT
ncbi:MAG: GatB/YqeY domain-containing protein [Patescibacteria group bacterium]